MAHYQVILAYDGTNFFGYQRQGKQRTVQAEVEQALRQINWQGRAILAAGRTDTGVHASGQVVAFDLDWSHGNEALLRAINAHLPSDVAVQAVQEAAPNFHPRYDARERTYQYRIYCQPERDPLLDRYAWRVWPALRLEDLQAAADLLVGTHDFAAFGTPPRAESSTIRCVTRAGWYATDLGWQPQAGSVLFEVAANAFLYHMVRRMVFLQVLVGTGRLALNTLEQGVLAAQPQTPGLAPPNGLVLTLVRYAEDM